VIVLLGGAAAAAVIYLALSAAIDNAIEKMYYAMRKRYLHSIYVEWEKQPEETREPYKRWKPKEVDKFNKLYEILFERRVPDSATKQPKANKVTKTTKKEKERK